MEPRTKNAESRGAMSDPSKTATGRRHFLRGGLTLATGFVLAMLADAQSAWARVVAVPKGIGAVVARHTKEIRELRNQVARLNAELIALRQEAIRTHQAFGDSVVEPPLDSPITWTRGQRQSTPPGHTRQILSLIDEVDADISFPWPLYIQLTSSHNQGDAAAAITRLIKTGNGWGTAYHAETFHDRGGGTTLGVNIEMARAVADGFTGALNIQASDVQLDQTRRPTTIDRAIGIQCQPQARFTNGIHFDPTSRGSRALVIEGQWEVGIDVGAGGIRMSRDAELAFDDASRFFLKYNSDTHRIEFHNRSDGGDRVIAYISADAAEHEL